MIESNFFGIDNGAAFLIIVYGFFGLSAYGVNLIAKWCDK
jgi:hypothetical protein